MNIDIITFTSRNEAFHCILIFFPSMNEINRPGNANQSVSVEKYFNQKFVS